jgi:hypothetical protein
MWIIQNETLLSIPDDAPLPPQSVKVDVPEDFRQNRTLYRIKGSGLIRSKAAEARGDTPPRLTQDDIARIKKAIERGDL